MTLGKPSRLFDGNLWRFIRARLRVHQDLEFRKFKTERISAFDGGSWVLSTATLTQLSKQLCQRGGPRCWARAPLQKSQSSQLSLLSYKRTLSKKLSCIKFYWDKRLNKFSLVLHSTWQGSSSLFSGTYIRHFESWIPSRFPVELGSVWRSPPSRMKPWTAKRPIPNHVPYHQSSRGCEKDRTNYIFIIGICN